MTNENARALALQRRRIDTVCGLCGAAMSTRVKGKADEPERRYCSTSCRLKAYYRAHKEERAEYQRKRRRPPKPGAPASEGAT